MYTAAQSQQFQNIETTLIYCNLCRTFVVTIDTFPVLHDSLYIVQLTFTPKLHEWYLGSAVTQF